VVVVVVVVVVVAVVVVAVVVAVVAVGICTGSRSSRTLGWKSSRLQVASPTKRRYSGRVPEF